MRRRAWRSPSGAPRTSASPLVGRVSPSRSLTTVVLPAPLGPRKPKTSPRFTVIDREFTATVSPKCLVSRTAWIAGEGAAPGERSAAGKSAASDSRTCCLGAELSVAALSAELLCDIQHVLRIDDSDDGMEQAPSVLPDDAGGNV